MTLEERFWKKVDKSGGPDACWPWMAGRNKGGYGQIRAGGLSSGQVRVVRAHRVAWELAHGDIPDGLCVCHRCDNRPCVNPAHLFLGTHTDNIRDRHTKGRSARQPGEAHGGAKLTAAEVVAIMASTEPMSVVAARYAVCRQTISNIRNGKNWTHLRPEGE